MTSCVRKPISGVQVTPTVCLSFSAVTMSLTVSASRTRLTVTAAKPALVFTVVVVQKSVSNPLTCVTALFSVLRGMMN